MNDIGFRKSALTKQGGFTPAKANCVAGVGIVKKQPKKPIAKPHGSR